MKKLQRVFLACVCLGIISGSISLEARVGRDDAGVIVHETPAVPEQESLLDGPNVDLLEKLFLLRPYVVARMILTLNNVKTILENLEALEAKLDSLGLSEKRREVVLSTMVQTLCGKATKDVSPFFLAIHDEKEKLHPVVKKIAELEAEAGGHVIDIETSLLGDPFQIADRNEIPTFFDDNTNTVNELRTLCKDFSVVFSYLEKRMVKAFEAGQTFLDEHGDGALEIQVGETFHDVMPVE